MTTDITTLPPTDRAMIVLGSTKTEADLRALILDTQAITAVNDKTDRELAHRFGMKLRTARTTIEKTGKAARDDATAFAKAVINEEKRLIAITEGEEKRVIGLRDAYDAKIEAEEEAKRQAEAKRVADIKRQIEGIRGLPLALAGASSDEIGAELAAIDQFEPLPEVFGEFLEECVATIDECVKSLKDLHVRVMSQEAAAALVEAERKRLEQVRIEAEQALAAERKELEEARAAIAKERAELEALRAAAQPVIVKESEPIELVQTGAEPEPVEQIEEPIVATDWRIREYVIHTASQFEALATKAFHCGFVDFAQSLDSIAIALREGSHDAAFTKANREAMIEADSALIDATAEAIDALTDEQAEAA